MARPATQFWRKRPTNWYGRQCVTPEAGAIVLGGQAFVGDADGALYWPHERLLVVSDLHLEKASSFARRGVFLPPYDTATTLARLADVVRRYVPRAVIALGDSFHDDDAPQRLNGPDRDALLSLQQGRDWIWISGNHDPDPAIGIGGIFRDSVVFGSLTFRHEPAAACDGGEVAGHLHPVARVRARGRSVSRKCFACDGQRLIMPAFGVLTGGLNVRDRAFAAVFSALDFTAHMLGRSRLYAIAASRCLPD
ncbi:MAG: ligase-associated DNA damage response endonuclease PdeM [Pseudorhodoplanes sp.]|nr:ligase-associated DNA damage response endonuclease PdeM [Pseudorhodoplanes sp.]